MEFAEYQVKAHSTACYGKNIVYPIGALAEEASEVADVWASWFGLTGTCSPRVLWDDIRVKMSDELGDVMWNIAELHTVLNVEFSRPEHSPDLSGSTLNIPYYLCNLNSKVGKLVGVYTKYVRKHNGVAPNVGEGKLTDLTEDESAFVSKLICALKDVLDAWYLCVAILGLNIDSILEYNIEKLSARKKSNTLGGEGSIERK